MASDRRFVALFSVSLSTYYGHSGDTFSTFSNPTHAYNFVFGFDAALQQTALTFTYSLLAGESVSYRFGTFNPVGGVAPTGIYQFLSTGLTLNLVGTAQKTDVNGDLVFYAAGDTLLDLHGNPLFDINGDPMLATAGDPVVLEIEHSIVMADTSNSGIAFVRNVAAVPEPETWAMLLAGLGLVGCAVRRRRLQ